MTDTVERFSNRVANYVKYRPDYPREIIAYLESRCGLTHESIVADIGCGTGISSQLFLENCNTVYGIEPNDAMREAAVKSLKDFPAFKPVAGASEATTLPDASVDMVVAAQAFHWFDLSRTKPEFRRIVKPGGHVVLMWNERQLDTTPFLVGYEELLVKYSTDYTVVRHDKFDAAVLNQYFDGGVHAATFPNVQIFDFEGLKGRMLSASYMPSEDHPVFPEMIAELQSIFAKHAENGRIRVFYDTNLYHSRI